MHFGVSETHLIIVYSCCVELDLSLDRTHALTCPQKVTVVENSTLRVEKRK